ncbi:MAG: hypothetical protein AB8W37_11045 [Arsenophonus endosymbiont of Dermacentor nuttalli]
MDNWAKQLRKSAVFCAVLAKRAKYPLICSAFPLAEKGCNIG